MSAVNMHEVPSSTSPEAIATWLHHYLADLKGMSPERISRTQPLYKYGLDSASAVTLTGDLMEWLKIDIDPSALYEYPTIERVSEHLSSLVKAA